MSSAFGALPTLKWVTQSHPGTIVRTTLDAGTQREAFAAARQQLEELEPSGVTAAAVVVLDTPTGECLAAVSLTRGSRGVDLTRSLRSTGSTLKPFIYAAAFDAGIATPATILHDTPAGWAGYVPGDFDGTFRGDIPAAAALAESRNIPALQLLSQVGVERAAGLLGRLGFAEIAGSPQRYGLSLAIGGAEASPLDIAQAYATLARGGVPREASFVMSAEAAAEIVAPGGDLGPGAGALPSFRSSGPVPGAIQQPALSVGASLKIKLTASSRHPERSEGSLGPRTEEILRCAQAEGYSRQPPIAVFSPASCWQTLAALSDPARTETISRAAARVHVAWKTGTSSGRRDAWCAAVTRSRTVVVWLGNPSGKGADPLVGREAAAPLALRLIASLDRQEQPTPWLAGDATQNTTARSNRAPNSGSDAIRAVPLDRRITLLSPADGSEILLDSDQPAGRQKVLLRAIPADGKQGRLWWFVGGSPVGETAGSGSLFWSPEPGPHEVRVVDSEGRSASARVLVR